MPSSTLSPTPQKTYTRTATAEESRKLAQETEFWEWLRRQAKPAVRDSFKTQLEGEVPFSGKVLEVINEMPDEPKVREWKRRFLALDKARTILAGKQELQPA